MLRQQYNERHRLTIVSSVDCVPVNGLYHADEIFLCTTAAGIIPIARFDREAVGAARARRARF